MSREKKMPTGDTPDDRVISDIRRVAASLNTSSLSREEYRQNGGIYTEDVLDDDFGGFANLCELAGIKVR